MHMMALNELDHKMLHNTIRCYIHRRYIKAINTAYRARLLEPCGRQTWLGGSLVLEFLVKEEFSDAGADALETSDEVSDLLDSFHLLGQVVRLNHVAHLGVLVGVGDSVQVQQRLVDRLLQCKGSLHGLQTGAPLISLRLLDVLEHDATSTLVLKLHQDLSVLTFLLAGLVEELGEAGQGDVIPVEVEVHRLVDIASIQLQIDLLVDPSLAILVVVLTAL